MRFYWSLLLAMGSIAANAQKLINLTPVPVQITGTYQYNKIRVIDSRKDTSMLGRVVKGTFGVSESLAPLKVKTSLQEAYDAFFTGSVSHLPKGEQDILIHITDLFVDEDPVLGSSGTIDFRAEVYAVRNGRYYPIHTYERQESVQAFDATKKLINELLLSLKNAVELSHGFFRPEVFNHPGFSYEEMLQAYRIERVKRFPVYGQAFKPGIYSSLRELLDNAPSRPIESLNSFMESQLAKPRRKRETIFGYCKDSSFVYFYNGNRYEDSTVLYQRDGEIYMQNWGADDAKQNTQNALAFFTPAALLLNTESWFEYVLNPRSGTWYQMQKLGNRKRKTKTPEPTSN